ncbi:MAG TPA: fumarate hydratase [Ruminococcaceae bacterium]|nr:fumarate hydratase [Oscillospiraceae bacterium]
MREISVDIIRDTIASMCIQANKVLPNDLKMSISDAVKAETTPLASSVMSDLMKNLDAAEELDIPICQDCGMAVVFLKIGQEVHFVGGNLESAVNEGVRIGYRDGFLRCSVVVDPLLRKNTGDNTPAVLHEKIVPGDRIEITVAPKGFGSENMSCLKMFTPAASREDIMLYVLESVKRAGGNPCPPIVLGIGIGGDFEQCAYLAKKALCRSVGVRNEKEYYRDMEQELLERINLLEIGPQGFGGKTTALAVNIETAPTHIAGLPVAVNFGCHVTRHLTRTI